jgi:hypothetical protein
VIADDSRSSLPTCFHSYASSIIGADQWRQNKSVAGNILCRACTSNQARPFPFRIEPMWCCSHRKTATADRGNLLRTCSLGRPSLDRRRIHHRVHPSQSPNHPGSHRNYTHLYRELHSFHHIVRMVAVPGSMGPSPSETRWNQRNGHAASYLVQAPKAANEQRVVAG